MSVSTESAGADGIARVASAAVQGDVLDFSPAFVRHAVEQETIDAVADAEGEDAGVRMLLHLADNLHVVADITIGHEDDDAEMVLLVDGASAARIAFIISVPPPPLRDFRNSCARERFSGVG